MAPVSVRNSSRVSVVSRYCLPVFLSLIHISELTGATGGKIARNGSYKVNAKLDGLTGQDVTFAGTVANWDALSTQDVNLGQ